MPLFTTLTSEGMCREIAAARKRVVLAAPGSSARVATALVEAHQRLPSNGVQVVLNGSISVSRLGYSEPAAAELLTKSGVPLRQQSGFRLGVLICHDNGWSFASAPRLVEADPHEQGDACNAIALTEAQGRALRAELPPTSVSEPSEPDIPLPITRAIPGERRALGRVEQALEIAPPQPFDQARQTRVYRSLLQFAELRFEGFSLESRRVQLQKSLHVIVSMDRVDEHFVGELTRDASR